MNYYFILILIIILVIFNFWKSTGLENFLLYPFYNTAYNNINQPTMADIDYQADLNKVSGYDSGTRGYLNPRYAQQVANDLST